VDKASRALNFNCDVLADSKTQLGKFVNARDSVVSACDEILAGQQVKSDDTRGEIVSFADRARARGVTINTDRTPK
jgi:hypothetical protein